MARESTPENVGVLPRRGTRRAAGGGDPLTTVVFDLSMAIGELRSAVATLSNQAQTQTDELRKIRDIVTGLKAIGWFLAIIATGAGLLRFWPAIQRFFLS